VLAGSALNALAPYFRWAVRRDMELLYLRCNEFHLYRGWEFGSHVILYNGIRCYVPHVRLHGFEYHCRNL